MIYQFKAPVHVKLTLAAPGSDGSDASPTITNTQSLFVPLQITPSVASDALHLQYQGFNYPAFYNGGYENGDTLADLQATGSNSVALEDEYSIDVKTSTIVTDANYTDSLQSLGATIKEAEADGQQVMVRPLIDFLNPSIDNGMTGDWRSYFNPSDPAAFFASYKTMLVDQATVAQQNGAQVFCIGTELDQLTGPAYLSYWTDIISAVRDVFSGKLTYSAEYDDNTSPWQYGGTGLPAGTGNIATQVSFWNQLDYVGIDEYAPISDAANPTQAQLVAGWEQTPTDASVLAFTGNQSLISYFEGVSATIGKPLFFTELGYEDATDAAKQPFYTSTNVVDQPLQTALYQAFGTAWAAENNGSLIGVNFWNWDPDKAETAPADGPNFSPQSNPAALSVIESEFATCYCPGTLIETESGMVAVEALSIGDHVRTMFGGMKPIKWIGRRSYAGRLIAGRVLLMPVCIKKDAIEAAVPSRDLWVSPGHGIYLDGVIVPAWLLVNGKSIFQADAVDQVTYIHIELEEHEIVFAEGCAAETFFDADFRNQFQNAAEFYALYPDAQAEAKLPCAPRVEAGFHLQAIQLRLAERAGIVLPAAKNGVLRGYVDQVGPRAVTGWAQDFSAPEQPVCLDILLNGRRVARVLANQYRADLRQAGIGSGRHAFEWRVPAGFSGRFEVRRSADQAVLALTEAACAMAA
jgi:hypothetical protein